MEDVDFHPVYFRAQHCSACTIHDQSSSSIHTLTHTHTLTHIYDQRHPNISEHAFKEDMLTIFVPLKAFFFLLSEEKCVAFGMFEDELTEWWLAFAHGILTLIQ